MSAISMIHEFLSTQIADGEQLGTFNTQDKPGVHFCWVTVRKGDRVALVRAEVLWSDAPKGEEK